MGFISVQREPGCDSGFFFYSKSLGSCFNAVCPLIYHYLLIWYGIFIIMESLCVCASVAGLYIVLLKNPLISESVRFGQI